MADRPCEPFPDGDLPPEEPDPDDLPRLSPESLPQPERQRFLTLVAHAEPLIVAVVRKLIGPIRDRCDPNDVFAEARRRVLMRITPALLADATQFTNYLARVARNICYDQLRAHEREHKARNGAGRVSESAVAAPSSQRPSRVTIRREQEELVRLAVAQLQPVERRIVTSYYFEGKTTAEIAAMLGITADAVRKRLREAQAMLRRSVGSLFDDLDPGDEPTDRRSADPAP